MNKKLPIFGTNKDRAIYIDIISRQVFLFIKLIYVVKLKQSGKLKSQWILCNMYINNPNNNLRILFQNQWGQI